LKEEVGEENIVSYIGSYLPQITSQLQHGQHLFYQVWGWAAYFIRHRRVSHSKHHPQIHREAALKVLPWLALIILALLLLLFWRSCQKQTPAPNSVAEPTASSEVAPTVAATSPASLSLTSGTGNQVLGCQSNVGDSGLASLLQTGIAKVFGTGVNCNIATDSAYATITSTGETGCHFKLVKEVPNASIDGWVIS
jgi:hypothetical protein